MFEDFIIMIVGEQLYNLILATNPELLFCFEFLSFVLIMSMFTAIINYILKAGRIK